MHSCSLTKYIDEIDRAKLIVHQDDANQKTYIFPPNKQDQEVSANNQHQHEEYEEVHVFEEGIGMLIFSHVTNRIDVNQKAYAGHNQHHGYRQGVDQKGERD